MADVPCAWLKGPTGEQSWKRLCVFVRAPCSAGRPTKLQYAPSWNPQRWWLLSNGRQNQVNTASLSSDMQPLSLPTFPGWTHGQDLAYSRVAVKPQVRDACCPEIKCFNCDHSISTPMRAHEWLLAYRSHVRIVIPLMKRTHGRKSQTGFTL